MFNRKDTIGGQFVAAIYRESISASPLASKGGPELETAEKYILRCFSLNTFRYLFAAVLKHSGLLPIAKEFSKELSENKNSGT